MNNIRIEFEDGITSGIWTESSRSLDHKYKALVIATMTWWIWKARCIAIFRDGLLNHFWVVREAVSHVDDQNLVKAIMSSTSSLT